MGHTTTGVIAVLAGIALFGLHVSPTFYTSDAQSYYDQARLLQDGQLTSEQRVRGWIPVDGQYAIPHSPGYSLLGLPLATATQLTTVYRSPSYRVGAGFHRDSYDLYRGTHIMETTGQLTVTGADQLYVKSLNATQQVTVTDGDGRQRTVTADQRGTSIPLDGLGDQLRFEAEECWQLSSITPRSSQDVCGSVSIGLEDERSQRRIGFRPLSYVLGPGGSVSVPINTTEPYRFRLFAWSLDGDGSVTVGDQHYDITEDGRTIMTHRSDEPVTTISAGDGPVSITYLSAQPRSVFQEADGYEVRGDWYLQEGLTGIRWASGNASIRFERPVERLRLGMTRYRPQTVRLAYGDTLKEVMLDDARTIVLEADRPFSTVNITTPDCTVPATVEDSDDRRCLAYGVKTIDPQYPS